MAIIGLGSFGMSLADALHAGGIVIDEIIVRPKNLSNRTVQSQARRFGARLSALSNAELHAQVVWICTPDDTIRGVAGRVAPRLTAKQVILHSSGALGSDILRGGPAAKASAHPMMSFARGKVTSLQKVAFAVEGDRRGAVAAAKLIRRCGADFFRISSEHKTLYHVFGSFCSPLFTALLVAGEETGRTARLPLTKIRKLSLPIISRTLENYSAHGAAGALTGPLQRGDVATIQSHLSVLAAFPDIQKVYVALSRIAVEKLPVKNKRALKNTLAV